jgi:hypothetical protein
MAIFPATIIGLNPTTIMLNPMILKTTVHILGLVKKVTSSNAETPD